MAYFPLFIELEGRRVLAVGAGVVGSRRIAALAEFGAELTVVAPEAAPSVERLAAEGRVSLLRGTYEEFRASLWEAQAEREPFFLVLSATGDAAADRAVMEDGQTHGAFVNCAGDRSRSNFYFPGLVKDGAVTAGVIAGGTDHRLAKEMTERVREAVARR